MTKATVEVMTIPQVALELGVRYSAARDLILKGSIKGGTYRGRNLIVTRDQVESFRKIRDTKKGK